MRQIEERVEVNKCILFIVAGVVRNRHRCARLSNGVVIPFGDCGTTRAALQHDRGTAVAVF